MINAEGQSITFNHTNITNCKSAGAMLQQSQGLTRKCVISVGQTKPGQQIMYLHFQRHFRCHMPLHHRYLLKTYDQISIFYPTTQNVITCYIHNRATALNYCLEMSTHPKLRKLRITVQVNACQESLQIYKVV
jgi:hypothetical protein